MSKSLKGLASSHLVLALRSLGDCRFLGLAACPQGYDLFSLTHFPLLWSCQPSRSVMCGAHSRPPLALVCKGHEKFKSYLYHILTLSLWAEVPPSIQCGMYSVIISVCSGYFKSYDFHVYTHLSHVPMASCAGFSHRMCHLRVVIVP